MQVERVEIVPFSIPFRRPFHAAGIKLGERHGVLITLADEAGNVGFGEVSTHPLHARDMIDEDFVERLREASNRRDFLQEDMPRAAWPGVEMASLDLDARSQGVRVADLLGGAQRQRVPVNAMLDHGDPREAAQETRRIVELGFECIKVKVSPADVSNDDARLAAIRAAAGRRVRLRIDANAAWSVEQAIDAISRLDAHGLEYVEQPVAEIEELARVRERVRTPIAADESVTSVAAVEAIARAHAADVVVVKPALLGLRVAFDVVAAAIALGLGVVVTSMLDTSIGTAAALHLAATLPEPPLSCGLATLDLLAGDLVSEPLVVRDGHMELPVSPGLGVVPDPASLKRWARSL